MKKDRFGNPIHPELDYARGNILRSSEEEELRRIHGLTLIKERILKRKSVFNLTGVTSSCPIEIEDIRRMESWLSFAHYCGQVEEMAVKFSGGDPKRHTSTVLNQGTSAILAVMLRFVKQGETVISITYDRTYPTIVETLDVVGGNLIEVLPSGVHRLSELIQRNNVSLLIITPISTRKHHLCLELTKKIISIGKEYGILTFLDDAWASLRVNLYHEPRCLEIDADLALLCPEKYMFAPRAGVIVGRKDLVKQIEVKASILGLKAHQSQYISLYNALKKYAPYPIKRSGELTDILFNKLSEVYRDKIYHIGGGVAMSEEDLLEIVSSRTEKKPSITPAEASSAHAMIMLRSYGIITGPTMTGPRKPPYLRLMLFPDGDRLGVNKINEAMNRALNQLAKVIHKPKEVREIILGK